MALSGAIRAGGAFVEIWAQDGRFQQAMNRVQARLRATAAFMRRMGTEMVMGGTAIGMPMVLAARQAARFEDTLLGMRAAAGLAGADVARLEQEVMRLSMAMGVDPTAISSAFLELTKAGMTVDQVLAGAGRSAVEFARVSGVEMADAAVFMKVAMNTFGVSATQAVDTLSAAADQSETNLQELVQAFALVGSAGVTFDQTLSDLSTGLAVLARYGIRSEEAGTGIKTMLMRLVSPADTAIAALAQMGLTLESFRDADGNLLPLAQIIDVVAKATDGMEKTLRDKLLGDIFGDRAIRIIGAFIDAGVAGFNEMQAAMMESLPVAEKFRVLMSGLTGGFQRIYAAVQRLAIAFTGSVGPAFADLVDFSVFALETLGMLSKEFPILVGRVVVATAALTALGVATIVGGFAVGVMARGFAVLTGVVVAALQPFVLLGRATVFLSLAAIRAGAVVGAAFARMAVAVGASVVAMLPALASLAVQMGALAFRAAFLFSRAMLQVVAVSIYAAGAMTAAFVSALPRMLSVFGIVASELLVLGRYMRLVLAQMTFGLSTMVGRAVVSLAALAASFVMTGITAVISMAPVMAIVGLAAAAVAGLVGAVYLLAGAAQAGFGAMVGAIASAYSAVTGLASRAMSAGAGMVEAAKQSAAAWAEQFRWMYEQVKAQNFSAIWQAIQLDFQIAMLMIGKHVTTAGMLARGVWDATASYMYDVLASALEKIAARFGLWLEQLKEALGMTADVSAARARVNAGAAAGAGRQAQRQAAADERQAAIDAERAKFDDEVAQLRSDLDELMQPQPKEEQPPAGPSAVVPTEFREPAAGIGPPGGGSGIGQTQGTFSTGEGIGIGPELNTLRDHAAATAERAAEIAAHTKRSGDLLGMIAAEGGIPGAGAVGDATAALTDTAGPPVLAAQTAARMPQLAADSQAGVAQAMQIVQLRIAMTAGLDAVASAVRENTAVTSNQGAQLGSIAAAITNLRGTLV